MCVFTHMYNKYYKKQTKEHEISMWEVTWALVNENDKFATKMVDGDCWFRLRLSYSCFFLSLIILVEKKSTIWGRSRIKKHSSKLSGHRRLRRRFVVATVEFVSRIYEGSFPVPDNVYEMVSGVLRIYP